VFHEALPCWPHREGGSEDLAATATYESHFGLETSIDEADRMSKLATNRPRRLSWLSAVLPGISDKYRHSYPSIELRKTGCLYAEEYPQTRRKRRRKLSSSSKKSSKDSAT
jgi:hypothetical protein